MPISSPTRTSGSSTWFFVFFLISGFCSIFYELVWLRLAMAQFGVTTPLVSMVLSMFMAGLGLGSWIAGRLVRNYDEHSGISALALYGLTELAIGVSAILVPYELVAGHTALVKMSLSSSASFYLASGVCVALTLLPWCACMGATIPVMMLAIRNRFPEESDRSFSFLYLANVLGAVAGSMIPLLLIELYGFRGTLRVGTGLNFSLAAAAFIISFRLPALAARSPQDRTTRAVLSADADHGRILALLFGTGCTSMGIEVVWIRQFTPYIGTVVYAFATILGLYLLFTFIGSRIYRRSRSGVGQLSGLPWALLGLTTVISALSASPTFHLSHGLRVLFGVAPFSGMAGFLTPMLVDRWSGGDPDRAGRAYAVNVVGCIIGPLLSGFILLPFIGERWVLMLFALPWLVIGGLPSSTQSATKSPTRQIALSYAVMLVALITPFAGIGYGEQFSHKVVLRDSTATVIATGEGMEKRLLVNGYGMTILTPITKMMAHLPLTDFDRKPENALVICFGMGTTYRSILSWHIPVTAVELVPSVPQLFWFYHSDAAQLLQSPHSHIVVDDGRRYLERTGRQFDLIVIDPPPPVEAAGSSLLYTKEFYSIIRQRLTPAGLLQQWLPETGDRVTQASVARALAESFPYVRVFRSVEHWGYHFAASAAPIPNPSPTDRLRRMSPAAITDMMEWGPETTPEQQFAVILDSEIPISEMIARAPDAPAIADNRPINEYYILRRRLNSSWQGFMGDVRMPANAQAALR